MRAGQPDRPFVLVLGSSRTAFGVCAGRLSADPHGPLVFNAGMLGAGPILQQVFLRRLLASGTRPDLVCLEVMPAMLSTGDGRRLEEAKLNPARLSARELSWVYRLYDNPGKLLRCWLPARLLPTTRHQEELRQVLGLNEQLTAHEANRYAGVDGHGFRVLKYAVTPEERAACVRIARGEYTVSDDRLADGPVRALVSLLELCRAEGIRTVLVVPPEGEVFRTFYPAGLSRNVDALLARLVREFQVPVCDARYWVKEEDFWDSHHLLPEGAARYTDRLGREVLARMTMPGTNGSCARNDESGRGR
jgi:hypothetical protein